LALMVTVLCGISVMGHAIAATQTPAGVNRTVPKVSPPAVMSFSSPPTDGEFLRTGLFEEPLAPVAATNPEENRDLAQAMLAYRDAIRESGANDAVEPLLTFLIAHPRSPWTPALQLNLGIIYRQTGHFSKALDVWQAGWNSAQTLSDPRGRSLANAMVARLSQLEAYLGRKELLRPLLDSIQDRQVGGTAAQLITDSHLGLYNMVYYPGESFRCGPLALLRILKYGNSQPSAMARRVLEHSPSTDHGLSISAVEQIAAQAGMDYQIAFRMPGSAVIMPAVAHWKVGHYAAIVDRRDGRYIVEDTTFGEDIHVSSSTLDEEASGYFLVPAGPLPAGWRPVSTAEGAKVWGRGDEGIAHDPGATGCGACGGVSDSTGIGNGGYTTSAVELEVAGLQLHDRPVGYTPPVGPQVNFDLYYSHRDTQQPTTFAYTNFGPKWTFTWLSYITDTVNSSASAMLYLRGGGNEPFTFSSTSATTAYPGPYDQTVLTRTVNGSGASTGFTLTFPDGSYEQFDQALGGQFFMTAVSDAAGNIVTLTYDAQMRIVAITDAIGQVSTISYGLRISPLAVTEITDPFGRSAIFTYSSSGLLASITDVLGITSSYSYGQGTDPDFVNAITTPYGTTSFTYGDSTTNNLLGATRFLTTVDPLSRTSYVEYSSTASAGDVYNGSVNSAFVPTGMNTCNSLQNLRNTFVFDANQYALATVSGTLNYSLGKAIHWLASDTHWAMRMKSSEKEPLENRVWYDYPAQPYAGLCDILDAAEFGVTSTGVVTNGSSNKPSAIGRVLDSGATQLETFQYNSSGNVTQATDAAGRQWTYTYAANGIDRLTTSNTTNGSQLLETRTYNTDHLPLTVTSANGKTAHYKYNVGGQVTRYTDPLGNATTLNYDSDGRLKSIQGAISTAKYTLAYDNVSRIASVTDPAGATVHYAYDAADRQTQATYPDGTTTKMAYTLLDLTSSTDRLSQKTQYAYDADRELISTKDPNGNITQQGYSLAGKLNSITDPNGHATTFALDDQSRIAAKQFANGTSLNIVYENSRSLVGTITDALSQTKDYTYNADNTLATISYSAYQATPNVSFTYDPNYQRPTSMTDGVGTTFYAYYPVSSPELGANQLQSVTSPIAGTFNTDLIVYSYDALNRVVGTTINGVTQSIGFDALGRVSSASNLLDSFTYGYSDGTSRVAGVSSNAGPTAALSYFGPTGNELLEQLNYTTHNGGTSLAQFGYTYNSDNLVKSLTVSSPSAQTTAYGYDTANRLVSGLIGTGSPQYMYGYDHASNLTSIKPNGATESFSYSNTNTITAGSYDANGSPSSLAGNSYKWDGENRLVHFGSAANNTGSSFIYDGLGRLVRVVDTHGGAITGDHSYTWCESVRCLAHDNTQANSPVSTQYFDQGAIIGGNSYYYVKDQLGSVTHLVSTTGSITSQFSYDPYGNRTAVSGTVVPDIGYGGYFYHAVSGLDFTLHRAYDPVHARWLNRDPIGEAGGVNLFAYADGNPVTNTDPSGLLTSVDVACLMDPQFCLEIMGQIIGNNGAIVSKETGNQCVAEEADRIAKGFQVAGSIASIAQLGYAARGGLAAVRAGQAGEAAVRAAVDIGPKTAINIAGRTRIPDGLTNTVLSEVKNVKSLSFTQQLRDFSQYAGQKGLQFNLYVRPGAQLSGPLLDAEASGALNILEIPF
jgi:RHS repeat-associated protein